MSVSSLGDHLKQQRSDTSQPQYVPINKWSMAMVLEWLHRKIPNAYDAYANAFIHNQITGETLLLINEDCLDCLKIKDYKLR